MVQTTFGVIFFTGTPRMEMTHQRIVITLWTTINMLPVVFCVLRSAELQHRNDLLHSA